MSSSETHEIGQLDEFIIGQITEEQSLTLVLSPVGVFEPIRPVVGEVDGDDPTVGRLAASVDEAIALEGIDR